MNILDKYEKALSREEKQILSYCSKLANEINTKIFLVGGIVRDILLNRPFNDIDVLVEDDAILFVQLLQKNYPENVEILTQNDKFRTAKLKFKINNKNFEADFASTRSEKYEYPSALPILEKTGVSLEEDINRRDFTINTLAMSLNSKSFCNVLDKTEHGLDDLNNGLIRILHNKSFMDDPSRIVRGLKYRTKLNFILEKDTRFIQEECLNSKKYDDDCQERIKKEVIETLNLLSPECFDKFISENIYKLIISQLSKKNLPSGHFLCEIINSNIKHIDKNNVWLIYLSVLFNFAPFDLMVQNLKKLALNRKEQNIINDFFKLKNDLPKLETTKENYNIYKIFQQYSFEAIIATLCLMQSDEIINKIYLYLNKLQFIKLSITGNDISKEGIPDGIIYKEIFNRILRAKLNFNLSPQDEKQYLKSICKSLLEN